MLFFICSLLILILPVTFFHWLPIYLKIQFQQLNHKVMIPSFIYSPVLIDTPSLYFWLTPERRPKKVFAVVVPRKGTPTLISMRISEGSGAVWLQSGWQEAALTLPCFLFGVVAWSCVPSPTTHSAWSRASGSSGLAMVFITRSYLLFHSRLIRAEREKFRNKVIDIYFNNLKEKLT